MCPAVVVSDGLERMGDANKRPGNTHHRVVRFRIVHSCVTAPLWKEGSIPVGHEIPGSYTHCIQPNVTAFAMRDQCVTVTIGDRFVFTNEKIFKGDDLRFLASWDIPKKTVL